MSLSLLVPVAAASLLGSIHCAGMCGGFVAIAGEGTSGKARMLPQLTYNAGRLVSYTVLGAVAGTLGRALDLAGNAAGIGRVAALVSGAIMILWGMGALLETQGVRIFRGRWALPKRLTEGLARLRRLPATWRGFVLGLATTLLPCGWLYAFAVTAAGTGSALHGALLMAAFWSGNLPVLLGLGAALNSAIGPLRRHVPLLSAAVIFGVGLFTVTARANLPAFAANALSGCHSSPALGAPSPGACPCHRKAGHP
ncbi:MAG TPA: sulfite exporter TauE/SafE family protein [Polyangiaceae bacterium]|nr:sulfite exporter TauE/SafE family protein [Polyangiaceae bacterium]